MKTSESHHHARRVSTRLAQYFLSQSVFVRSLLCSSVFPGSRPAVLRTVLMGNQLNKSTESQRLQCQYCHVCLQYFYLEHVWVVGVTVSVSIS